MAMEARLIPFEARGGAWNMAADEVLLENAVAGQAAIRFYGWDPPTLSLGYFQAHADRLRDPGLAALPWVRRATGGGAIVHNHDLTYAVAIPSRQRAGLVASCWHDRLHHVLTQLLNERGFSLRVATGERLPPAALGYRCFAVPQPGDVVLHPPSSSGPARGAGQGTPLPPIEGPGGTKVIGGAQRLRAGAVLQHGSIQLPGALELADALALPLAEALGWRAFSQSWTEPERRRIAALARDKYQTSAWNEKR